MRTVEDCSKANSLHREVHESKLHSCAESSCCKTIPIAIHPTCYLLAIYNCFTCISNQLAVELARSQRCENEISKKNNQIKRIPKQENVRTLILRADSRGDEPPDLENKAAPLAPIATFDEGGIVLWDEKVKHEINRLATTPTSTRCRSRQ